MIYEGVVSIHLNNIEEFVEAVEELNFFDFRFSVLPFPKCIEFYSTKNFFLILRI